ncbi:MAG: acyl carrier protein, partial [Phycicoccus sp.]
GLDSLGMVGLSRDLAAIVDPDFRPSTLFDHSTVARLAEHLAGHAAPQVERLVAVPATHDREDR